MIWHSKARIDLYGNLWNSSSRPNKYGPLGFLLYGGKCYKLVNGSKKFWPYWEDLMAGYTRGKVLHRRFLQKQGSLNLQRDLGATLVRNSRPTNADTKTTYHSYVYEMLREDFTILLSIRGKNSWNYKRLQRKNFSEISFFNKVFRLALFNRMQYIKSKILHALKV